MHYSLPLTAFGLSAALLAGPSVAAERHDKPAGVASQALGGVSAPYARLAAVIDQGGGVVRSKGVAQVTRPGTGRYCIRPAASANINVNTIVPSVTVDWSNSSYNEVLAQYRSAGAGCPGGTIAIVTFADVNLDGRYSPSNEVAYTIVVP
jgi:hypothetical protein